MDSLPTMRARRVLGRVGRTLMGAGVLVLLFVAYQLWGTALHERRAQDRLEDEFAAVLATADDEGASDDAGEGVAPQTAPETTAAADEPTADAAPVTDAPPDEGEAVDEGEPVEARFGQPPEPAEAGDPVARLRIPAIGVDKFVVSGVGTEDLKAGPGHFPGTPLPGQAGNAAIAGHRTTYGAPFIDFDLLEDGDEIFVTTPQGEFTYEVSSSEIVDPSAVHVLAPFGDNRLTFTTCHPKRSDAQRLVVVAHLVGGTAPGGPADDGTSSDVQLPGEDFDDETVASAPAETTPTTITESGSAEPDSDQADSDQTAAGDANADEAAAAGADGPSDAEPVVATAGLGAAEFAAIDLGGDLSGGASSRIPVLVWGLITAVLAIDAWLLSKLWRRVPAYAVLAPFFVVSLFVFYENVSRLLPANV